MGELYDLDVYEWSQHQAALLRRRAAGELVNEAELDWPNIAEEVESVGRDQLHAVESFLVQALVHDLKAEACPLASYVPGWRAEARRFRAMRQPGSPRLCESGWTWRKSTAGRCGPCRRRSTASPRCRSPRRARSRWTSCWPRA